MRTFTTKPVLITETAVGQDAGRSAKIPGLFDGMQRFDVRGIVWFDINQTGGVHHQRWALGHLGDRRVQEGPGGLAAERGLVS